MKKFPRSKKIIMFLLMFWLLAGGALIVLAKTSSAQGGILPKANTDGQSNQIVPEECAKLAQAAGVDAATYCGNYELNDFVALAINISRWILGIVGSLTLAMFLWGGITLLTSAGASEKIAQAKKTMLAAVIGLMIVFGSYLIIKGVMASMGRSWDGQIKTPEPLSLKSDISDYTFSEITRR